MYDIIVIGAGPAGLNAALYALRGGKSVLILEGNGVGGQIANSPKVENLPTIKEISGIEFAMNFADQVEEWGGIIEYSKATKIEKDYSNNTFTVTTEESNYQAKAIIVAVGVHHKHMNVPGEQEFLGKGVYYCAVCDGPFYAGQDVALIGDGNTAMQYALLLSNICKNVYLLTWMDKFFGDKVLEKAVRSKENIIHMPKCTVAAFKGDTNLSSIDYFDSEAQELKTLEVPAAFVAIGQVPDNSIFRNFSKLSNYGYFTPKDDMSTETSGMFVAGDCRDKKVRQVVTAVADGAVAAISACNYIDSL